MAIVEYGLDEKVAVITLNDGENRFNPPFFEAFLTVLDEIEKATDANALVVTSSHDNIFCNGFDLDWMDPLVRKNDKKTLAGFFYTLNKLLKRVLLYPMPTIAAISGHVFGGGALMTCAFDFRFMRSDRGFFCFPEVDVGIPFLPGSAAIIMKAIPMYKFEEMQYTGKRATADECEAHHIVLKACLKDHLMNESLTFAKGFNKRREVIDEMKKRTNRDIIHTIDVVDPPLIKANRFFV